MKSLKIVGSFAFSILVVVSVSAREFLNTYFNGSEDLVQNGNVGLWIMQIVVTLSFTFIGAWLFFSMKYKSKDKKWFKFIFLGKEWGPVLKTKELGKKIAQFQQEK